MINYLTDLNTIVFNNTLNDKLIMTIVSKYDITNYCNIIRFKKTRTYFQTRPTFRIYNFIQQYSKRTDIYKP